MNIVLLHEVIFENLCDNYRRVDYINSKKRINFANYSSKNQSKKKKLSLTRKLYIVVKRLTRRKI